MDEVKRKKRQLLSAPPAMPKASSLVQFTGVIGNAIVGNNNVITIKDAVPRKAKPTYPEGCIGFDNHSANYVGYLIGRYNEYKKFELKEKMNYATFPALLKRQFKLGPSRTIYNTPIEQFDRLIQYIQNRIDGTLLAKVKKSKGQLRNYSSFEEYRQGQILK